MYGYLFGHFVNMWRPHLVPGTRQKSLALVEALEADIASGRVASGERLPAQRVIAEALGIDLTTVTRAFNEARRRGLIEARAGRGTFVSRGSSAGNSRSGFVHLQVDMSMNIPPQPASIDLRKLLPHTVGTVLGGHDGGLHLQYQESTGTEFDRRHGAEWLSRRVAPIGFERVVVAAGAQTALFAVSELVARPGEAIAAGEYVYPGLRAVALQRGLAMQPVAMDEAGLLPDSFEKACLSAPVRALCLVPNIDNPTTATLPGERRRAVADIARRHGVAIIEDDPYGALLPSTPPAFAEIAPDITWHVATLSKCATPGLRIAYVAAPSPTDALRLAGVLRATTLTASPLTAAIASQWIADGTLDRIAAAIATENRARQALAANILGQFTYRADPHGHHLWLDLPDHWRARDFSDRASLAGVPVVASQIFAIGPQPREAVRISLGLAPDREALSRGLTELATLMERPALHYRPVV